MELDEQPPTEKGGGKMTVVAQVVLDLDKCHPLIREFCKLNRLCEGDLFKSEDLIAWNDSLTLEQRLEIFWKYERYFLENCDL